LIDEPRTRVVNSRHECSAVFAAAAHARATGAAGVVLVTSGPGITNAITGMASCFTDGLPVVLIGGEVPRKNFGRGALQEGSAYSLNLVGMLKHVTKWASEVTCGDGAVSAIRKAMSMANSGRKGPVFLSLPLDGKGVFPESHPLSLGIFGHGGHPSATAYLDAGIDVLVAVGTSFGDAATNSWTDKLKPSRCSIHIDIDSSQIGRNYQVDLGLVGS